MKKVLYVSRVAKDNLDFIEAMQNNKPELEIVLGIYSNMAIYIENDQSYIELIDSHSDIASFDLVFFKTLYKSSDMASAIANYLDKKGVKYIDQATKYSQISSKLYQYVVLSSSGVNVPASIFIHPDKISECFQLFKEKLKLPFILKDIHGLKGRDNYLIKSEEKFSEVVKENKNISFIAQEYIENDGDYRVLVFGEKVQLVIHRFSNSDSHINNTSSGGQFSKVDISEFPIEVQEASVLSAKVLGRQVAGVDMVLDKNRDKWFCFEVNENPQMYTGALVEEKTKLFSDFLEEY